MRIAELTARQRFELRDAAPPEPAPNEVQVRVHAVGICGSDLHNFSEGRVGDTATVYPMVLGHEPAGVILKTGRDVGGWAAGQRVLLEPAVYCYHCEFCHSGRHNLCEHIRFYSAGPEPGFFRDIVTLPARNLLPLPEGLGFAAGTLFEPLAVALHSLQFAELRAGQSAAVFGAGPIGLLTIAALKMSGARSIFAVDPVPHRRAMATAFGADAVLDPDAVDAAREIVRSTGGRGVDVSIDCVARESSMEGCAIATARGGRVIITGIPSESRPAFHFHELRRKEIPLFNVRRSNHESELALRMLTEDTTRFAPLITHVRPLEQVEAAFSMLEHYRDGIGKAVIDLSGG